MLSHRENFLRAARFRHPQYIPANVSISNASRAQSGAELEEVLSRHPVLFPDFRPGRVDFGRFPFPPHERAGELVDPWGCRWRMACDGVVGTVVGHPLADYSALKEYKPPPVLPQRAQMVTGDWEQIRRDFQARRSAGRLVSGGLYHGFFFMRLTYLRGFENLLCSCATCTPSRRTWTPSARRRSASGPAGGIDRRGG